jgi:hypothetical protein
MLAAVIQHVDVQAADVHLVDIDLRWGVTREQVENDRVLVAVPALDRLVRQCRDHEAEELTRSDR